jgi:tyrosine-protein phosphatase YwqE
LSQNFIFVKGWGRKMAKNNHITSDHWKVGGSGHNGENILHEVNKQQYAQAAKAQEENASLIPNQQEHNETPAPRGDQDRGGSATPSSNSSSNDY